MYAVVQNIIDRARFELPGATDGAINLALFDAFDEWCRRSDANRLVADIPLVEDVVYYEVEFTNTVVVRVLSISHNEINIAATYDADEGQLVIDRTPTVQDLTYPLRLQVSVAPKPGIDDPDLWMGELLWSRYRAVILDGVVMKMASQVAKPYSNAQKALFHGKRFRNGMASTKAQSDIGNQYNGQSWCFPIIR